MREVYKLEKAPRTLDELAQLWRDRFLGAAKTQQGDQRLKAFIKGKMVYGACMVETRHLVQLHSGPSVHVACALDALIEGFFQDVEIDSSCPHCQEPINLRMVGRKIVSVNPASTVLWMGVSPHGEGPTIETICPYINFFFSNSHAAQWRERNLNQVGVLLDISRAYEFVNMALPEVP